MDLASLQFGLAPALATALLHSLWQVTLLGLAAAVVLDALGRRSAALRHALGMGFLVLMVIAPAVPFARFWLRPAAEINAGLLPAMTTAPIALPGLVVQQSAPTAGILSLLWLGGVLLMLVRHFGGWRLVGALDRKVHDVLPPDWQQRVDHLVRALGITRRVAVRLADDIASPFTARLLRPVVWLPLSLIARLPAEQVEALIAHELAHVARLDWLWNGVQCVVESLLFFHPAAWWLSRRIRLEREQACDDLAVAACTRSNPEAALALAEALARLECDRQHHPSLVLAAQGGSLMQRITRLLSGPSGRSRWRWPAVLLTLAVAGTVLVSQAGIARLPNVRIESTTDGDLGPGDKREITATGFDVDRHYVVRVDAGGKRVESYEVDGKPHPLDGDARRWLAQIDHMSVPPPPPPPPPAPPAPPLPPLPPPPPPAPDLADATDVKAILALVAADAKVASSVGSPVTLVRGSIDGNLRVDDDEGDAELDFRIVGPKGAANVDVDATFERGRWSIDTLDVHPD
jgi:beta-lactamase regulating signal transducer with metallopeptidase domain